YCYESGIGTKINRRRAFELYQKAADLGNARGIINLAYCYHRGIGTNVDKQKAFELFQKAANLEDADGLNYLGNYSTQNYSLNEKSDVYSVGVLLWEISANDRSPFKDKPYV
ncbi:hypothetical protein C1645_840659, partial [Glomus cerebriforme]